MKGVKSHDLRKKTDEELVSELKRLREELQSIRFSKVTGTAVQKLSKIKSLRKAIARVLTILHQNKKNVVVQNLRRRTTEEASGEGVKKVENIIKNLKKSHLPVDLRAKKTRAIRKRLTRHQSKLVQLRVLKRRLNFPRRRFAIAQ